jgi:UTP-glucose-1-phosphate uridylyltransferase
MAAGMGSRYGGLKQIDPVGPSGETLMDYSVYDAMRAGFGKVVFVIRKDIEAAFKETIGAKFESRIPVDYVFQELTKVPAGFQVPEGRTKPWGTTQAVLVAQEAIHEPFAVINADDFYGAEGFRVLSEHLQSGSPDYAMVGFVLSNTLSDFGSVARGVSRADSDGYMQNIVEMLKIERDGDRAKNTDASGYVTPLTGNELVSMNMWGFNPHVFAQLADDFRNFLEKSGTELKSECLVPTTINDLVASGKARVKVLRTNDAWFGVTYREDRPRVIDSIAALVQKGVYPSKLWQ